jgi:hypothetical protein
MGAFRFLAAVTGTLVAAQEINHDLIHSGFLAARHSIKFQILIFKNQAGREWSVTLSTAI